LTGLSDEREDRRDGTWEKAWGRIGEDMGERKWERGQRNIYDP
jgi:hypothetical protein